ncbi:uncharacterized protein [Ptychodera flava]|uniref:uncharacterized protein n=1 Tax=Ptychodera flava TaxID=63121 RepID=UPI00396A66B3
MGCKSSKIAIVDEKNEAWVKSIDPKASKPRSGKKPKRNVFLVEEYNDGNKDKTKRSGSESSLESDVEGQTRIVGSATSKVSSRTYDSGLGEDYAHVITETSDPAHHKIAEDGRPSTPEFTLTGTQIQTRKRSGKTRDSDDILQELQQQGLLSSSRPKSRGGLAFEVLLSPEGSLEQKRPPPRLAKLKKRSKKKKQLTKEQLEAKLIAAEERRKAKEQEMKEKLAAQISREKQIEALDAFAESQKRVAEQSHEKVDRATINREAKMKALQEKAQKRKEHAERVRQLKLQRQAEAAKLEQEQGTNDSGENQTEQTETAVES